MALNLENNPLFTSLQKLYSRVLLRAHDARTQSYRKDGQGAPEHDISASLAGHLDRLAASGSAAPSVGAQAEAQHAHPDAPTRAYAPIPGSNKSEEELVARTLEGLAKHLKIGHTGAVSQPALSDRLKSSAWTHLHAAFRLARQGDAAGAKVHADIANQALKELAHYMSDADYAALVSEVKLALAGVVEETRTTAPPN